MDGKHTKDIQNFGTNMAYISSSEVKMYSFISFV